MDVFTFSKPVQEHDIAVGLGKSSAVLAKSFLKGESVLKVQHFCEFSIEVEFLLKRKKLLVILPPKDVQIAIIPTSRPGTLPHKIQDKLKEPKKLIILMFGCKVDSLIYQQTSRDFSFPNEDEIIARDLRIIIQFLPCLCCHFLDLQTYPGP